MFDRIEIALFQVGRVGLNVLSDDFEARKFDEVLHEDRKIQCITDGRGHIAIILHWTPALEFTPAYCRA